MSKAVSNKRQLVSAVFVAGIAVILWAAITQLVTTPGVSNDLTQILTVARNIANGNGVVSDTVYYQEHHDINQIPVPQTVFPPGQPAIIAMLMKCGLPMTLATQLVSGSAFVLIAVCVFFLAGQCGASNEVSLVTAVLWLCVVLAWSNMVARKSDVPFTALTMLSACLLLRDNGRQVRNAIVAGIVAAIALTVRYAGLFFMTAVGVTLLVDWLSRRTRLQFKTLIGFCVPAGAMCAALFWRNYSLVGDIKGGNNYAIEKPFIEIVRNMYRQMSSISGLDYARLTTGGIAEWLMLLAAAMGIVWLFRSRKIFPDVSREMLSAVRDNRALLLSFFYPVLTVLMLYVLETKSQPGSRDRMYLAAIPFLFCGLARVGQAIGNHGPQSLFRGVFGGAVVVMLLGQANVAYERFGLERHEDHWYFLEVVVERPLGDESAQTLREFLSQRISHKHPLLVNEPQRTGELLQVPVVGLPSTLYTPETWTADPVRKVVDKYNIEYVICFTDAGSLEYEQDVVFFNELAAGNVPDWLEAHYEDEMFQVYRVR
jgi:DNA-dependent RNA polymerase auxiliary subunit epsilon